MGYYLDYSTITIDEYKIILQNKILTKSRLLLKENLEERFNCFKSMGIKNVFELEKLLKSKKKLMELAQLECLSEKFLTTLLRELKGTQPKPRKLADFTLISRETIAKLESSGIKNTAHLYDRVINPDCRKKLANETGLSDSEILELTQLTDLTRIQWVNTTFARVLYEAGYDKIAKVAEADYQALYNDIIKLNQERSLYKGRIGLNDMKITVQAAQQVPQEIEY